MIVLAFWHIQLLSFIMFRKKERQILNLLETPPGKVFPHQQAFSCRRPTGRQLRLARQASGSPHHLQQQSRPDIGNSDDIHLLLDSTPNYAPIYSLLHLLK